MRSPRTLLTAWNIQARKQLGQNFLKDPRVSQSIVERTAIAEDETVLEIGPGLGAITIPAAAKARKIIAIDKDGRMIGLLRAELIAAGIDNVTIREADILKVDIAAIAAKAGGSLVIMGNLPYNISSQVVVQLIHARRHIRRAVLMLQKEMAQRLCAGPGSKTYGRLSVMLGYCAEAAIQMQVRASQFFPAPKVDSSIVGIRFTDPPRFPADDEALLFQVVRAAFGKRRKTMRNALSQSDLGLDPQAAAQSLIASGIDPMQRAEQLSVAEFVRLSNTIAGR